MSTERIALASKFVNSTNRHIFLTGKAGTGKTTFLRGLRQRTHKNFIVVAPTGIAALNAGGVTIHSQFLFPLGNYIPDIHQRLPEGPFYHRRYLAHKHPLNKVRKKVLRSIDLLVIDEVSMLRADLLDAIDSRLRSARKRYREPFGGVQLLLIGDLYQLPPVVKDREWQVLRDYYASPHFFSAVSLQQSGLVYLELDKIFRQSDNRFITLLNNLRHNTMTPQDAETLNAFYQPEDRGLEEEVITLTTHNYRADQINQQALDALSSTTFTYKSVVEGDFPSSMFPVQEQLILKEGAQVMFIKNDSSGAGLYFNGKLATVVALSEEVITVKLSESNQRLTLHMERWENKKYTHNEEKQALEEHVVGAFEHYPIKLAWAITVHKSQGLTFDRAIIDVGKAFAPGQVYVALSRLRSLDGLVLRTRIDTDALSNDPTVNQFSKQGSQQPPLYEQLKTHQWQYLQERCEQAFQFASIITLIGETAGNEASQLEFEDAAMQRVLPQLADQYAAEEKNTSKFRRQLSVLQQAGEYDALLERILKGSDYYTAFLTNNIKTLLRHWAAVMAVKKTKGYRQLLDDIDQLQTQQLDAIEKLQWIAKAIIKDEEVAIPERWEEKKRSRREQWVQDAELAIQSDNPTKKKGRKRKVGETYTITYTLLKTGKSVEEVAKEREMAISTIYGHVAKGISEGVLVLSEVMSPKAITQLLELVTPLQDKSHKEIYTALGGTVSYPEIKVATAHLGREKSTENS